MQRERVKKLTGVDMKSVIVADEAGVLVEGDAAHRARATSSSSPSHEARKLASTHDADGKMRAAVDAAIAEIEQSGFGEVLTELERLKANPNWLGGILHKKK